MAGDLSLAASAGCIVAQPSTTAAGKHDAPQDWAKRLKLHLRACKRGDRTRRQVGLLGGQTALLKLTGNAVASPPQCPVPGRRGR